MPKYCVECTVCGAPNVKDARYCETCGHDMIGEPKAQTAPLAICPKCGRNNWELDSHCEQCSNLLEVPYQEFKVHGFLPEYQFEGDVPIFHTWKTGMHSLAEAREYLERISAERGVTLTWHQSTEFQANGSDDSCWQITKG